MELFRTKYSVWRCYPVLKGKTVIYTSSYRLYFRFAWLAKLVCGLLRAWDSLAAGEYFKSYSARVNYVSLYCVSNIELPIEFQDSGVWRCYTLNTNGDSLEELIANATISEVDQDGGDINNYGIEYGNEASDAALVYLTNLVKV